MVKDRDLILTRNYKKYSQILHMEVESIQLEVLKHQRAQFKTALVLPKHFCLEKSNLN